MPNLGVVGSEGACPHISEVLHPCVFFSFWPSCSPAQITPFVVETSQMDWNTCFSEFYIPKLPIPVMLIAATNVQTEIFYLYTRLRKYFCFYSGVFRIGILISLFKILKKVAMATKFRIWQPKLNKINHNYGRVHHSFEIFAAGWVIVVGDFKHLHKFSRDVAMATKFYI